MRLIRENVLHLIKTVSGEDVEDAQWLRAHTPGRVHRVAGNEHRVAGGQGLLRAIEGNDAVAGENVIGLRLGVAVEPERGVGFANLSDPHGQALCRRAITADQRAPGDGSKVRIITAFDGAIGLVDDGRGDHGLGP